MASTTSPVEYPDFRIESADGNTTKAGNDRSVVLLEVTGSLSKKCILSERSLTPHHYGHNMLSAARIQVSTSERLRSVVCASAL